MGMSNLLSKIGKGIDDGIDSVKKTVDDIGDKAKEAVKADVSEYFSETFDSMSEVAGCLNELPKQEGIKSFKVIDIEVVNGKLEMLLYITKA